MRVRAERVDIDDGVRFWLDEGCWADLPGVESAVATRLAQADGWMPTQRLGRGLDAVQRDQVNGVLTLFHAAGLAVEGRPQEPLAGLRLGLCGSGPLAREVAVHLLRDGACHLDVLARHDAHDVLGALRPRQRVELHRVSDVAELADRGCEVVVVAADTVEADREVCRQLVAHRLPHLVVGAHGDQGQVGPFVQPGDTGCLQCHDLLRTLGDPKWPLVLAQLSTRVARPQPAIVSLIAARVGLELGWLGRERHHALRLAHRVEVHDLHSPAVRTHTFAVDADCPCRWGTG